MKYIHNLQVFCQLSHLIVIKLKAFLKMVCHVKLNRHLERKYTGKAFSLIMAWLAEPFIEDMPPIGSFWHGYKQDYSQDYGDST